jgi:hypothetical protein
MGGGTASTDLDDTHGLEGLDALGRKLPARAPQLPKVVVAPREQLPRLCWLEALQAKARGISDHAHEQLCD